MALTVNDILECKALASAKIVAGVKGLGREISSVTVGEVPDIGDWLTGNEVVLSTFFATTADREARSEFVRKIVRSGASVLIAKPGRYIGSIDPDIIVLANRHGFPVIEVAPSVRWTHMIQQITERILGDHVSLLRRSEQIHRRLLGVVLDGGDLHDIVVAASELLARPVAIFDSFSHLLAASGPDGADASQFGELFPSSPAEDLADRLESARDLSRIGGAACQPIVAGDSLLGVAVALETLPLNPLDVVALEHTATVAAVEIGRMRIKLETEMRLRGDFLDDLMEGRFDNQDALHARAGYLGGDLTAGALALVLQIDSLRESSEGGDQRQVEQVRTELFKIASDVVGERHRRALVTLKRNHIVAFLPPVEGKAVKDGASAKGADEGESDGNLERARTTASRLLSAARRRFPDVQASVGLGRYYAGPMKVKMSYLEAEVALKIGELLGRGADVVAFDDVGAYKLLMRLLENDPVEFESFYQESFAPVADYDSRHQTELVDTLEAFFASDENIASAAEVLYAHRHTVRYRLRRIAEISGLNVTRSEDREKLSLGLKAHKLRAALSRSVH